MTAKKKVIAYKYLPTRFPISITLLTWLVLDRLHAPGIAQGVAWTLIGLFWIAAIVGVIQEDTAEPEWKKDRPS